MPRAKNKNIFVQYCAIPTRFNFNFPIMSFDSDPESDSNSTPSTEEGTLDAYMRDFEKLGTTPPRTRILRRHREKLKEKKEICEKNVCRTGSIDHGSLYIAGSRDSDGDSAVEIRKRVSKRNMQRLRGSERDLKLNIGNPASHSQQDRTESLPTMKVESSNRFLSLSCKLVKNAVHWRKVQPEGSRSRTEFHEKFVTILKSGNTEVKDKNCRRQVSREEDLWQAELKDLIWLELQAWHADRTPVEQDCYICDARKSVPQLLIDILNYRFEKKPEQFSTQSSDSGIHLPSPENETIVEDKCDPCPGCLWLFCPTCIEHENIALREVETLLSRLESAESLYPSSRAFADEYPLYKSAEFLNRVKAMCLWYNVTKHHRLKLLILGKQLLYYTKGSEVAGIFTVSSEGVTSLLTNPYEFNLVSQDFYNTQPLTSMGKNLNQFDSDHTHSYRKYIEDVLKIRGLRKALYFLEQLHLTVLRKARISLEKQNNKEANEKQEDLEEFELHRYGYWSVEAQSLNLPSYRPAFLFISRIPLDVIHEFLRMRLETKVDRPSALSIRQLIKELKEGLSLAVLHKERYLQHVNTALCEEQQEALNTFNNTILSFDNSVKSVLELYLNYLEQWVSLAQHERVQKNILEEEWKFVMSTVPHIPGGHSVSGNSFCNIATSMLSTICDELKQKVNELVDTHLGKDLDTSLKQCFLFLCRDVQTLCLDMRDRTLRVISLAKILHKHLDTEEFSNCSIISDSLANIKGEILHMSECLREVILSVEHRTHSVCLEESDNPTLLSRCREVLHQMYKFTFEYHKEVCRFFVGGEQCLVARGMITFAQQWLNFVITRCEKGKGVRPRWSNHGFDFLVHISDPKYTDYLTDEEFEEFKTLTEKAVAHIMGVATPTTTTTTPRSYMSTRARSSSPSPTIVKHKISFSNATENQQFVVILDEMNKQTLRERTLIETKIGNRRHRIKSAVRRLENERDSRLKNANLIGNVAATPNSQNERDLIRPRSVTFAWQRGIKIGQGRFGKVYTAVNNHSGELMAMKEISLQPNDLRTIRNVALELKIFEGLQHQHLVRYYGAEVRREELLIFMELCTEGTLESLVAATEGGLPEALIRRYTNQLVSAISALHQHSIVHRDIKTANIFLTAEGNCLKLGDFGSAVKIKAHTTVPGELKGFVGTQAYMAPEVFTKTHTEGHGRAADIWSLGCVIIEMASGIRPWSEYDSNYQIMFKVGMGEIPTIPDSLSDEGRHLVLQCLKHNPKERATTLQIKSHTFLKVDTEEECLSCTMPSVLEDYLKLGIKR